MTASPKSPLRSQGPGGTVRDSLASGIRTIDRQRGLGHEGCFGQAGPLRDLYEGLYRARARPGEFNSLDAQYCPAADQRSLNYRAQNADYGCKCGRPRSADLDSLPQGRLDRRFRGGAPRLLGKDAGGLSASTVGRLKDAWSDEHARWRQARSLRQARTARVYEADRFLCRQCRNSHVPKALMWLAARLLISCLRALEHWIPRRSFVGFFRRVSAAQNGGIAFLEFAGCKHWSSAAWPP